MAYSNIIKQLLDLVNPQHSPTNARVGDKLQHLKDCLNILDISYKGRFVHIAGSKGKSSVATMLASILTANNIHNLLFTSPALHKMTERFQIDSTVIDEPLFTKLAENLLQSKNSAPPNSPLHTMTLFECLTALMFSIYHTQNIQIGIIETGIGGRLDSTNIITPLVSVIQPIELDHCHILGDDIATIASEKAGIIKSQTPVVIAKQSSIARQVLQKTAAQHNSKLISAEDYTSIEKITQHPSGITDIVINTANQAYAFSWDLLGEQQIENARVAITVAEILNEHGYALTEYAISNGLERIRLPGRIQIIQTKPYPFIVDSCHTNLSAKALVKYINLQYTLSRKIIIVIGCLEGHENDSVIKELLQLNYNPTFIATTSRHPHAISAQELSELIKHNGGNLGGTTATVSEALKLAQSYTNSDLQIACGSMSVTAEVVQCMLGVASDF